MSRLLFVLAFAALCAVAALVVAAFGQDSIVVPAPGRAAPAGLTPANKALSRPPADAPPQAPAAVGRDSPPADPTSPPAPPSPPVLLSPEREKLARSYWPAGKALEPLSRRPLIFYDESVVPRVYQVFDQGDAGGIRRTRGARQTANNEFPWARPAGTNEGDGVSSVRFVSLPGPVRWWRTARDGTFAGFRWQFPEGTTFGEILIQTDPAGGGHAWEMRTRTKRDGSWSVQVYRPFVTEDDLAAALKERGVEYDPPPARHLRVDSGHQKDGFAATGWTVTLPALPSSTVAALLDNTPFEPALGRPWRVLRGGEVEAPTSDQDFSVVPKGFMGWALPVDNAACMRCHRDAGRVVNLPGEERWKLRGGDGILSFSIFDKAALDAGQVKLNRKLREAGLIVHARELP